MCTAVTLRSGREQNYFGRTMDFSYCIDPRLYFVPKNYAWQNVLNGSLFSDLYAFMAIGQESDGTLGFFDGVNEKGLAAAALYFPGYARYDADADAAGAHKKPVASLDFLHYILGKCGSVEKLEELSPYLSVVGVPDPVTGIAAPLHWIAADRSGRCVVVEPTDRGLEVHRNPIGVMANSPGFQWQMTNLRNYVAVSPKQTAEADWGDVRLEPFGQAAGTMRLPGGYTSPERFVRTAYLKTHVKIPAGEAETVVTCFHILDSVTVPEGVVETDRGTYDYTKYIAFINTSTCEYFFRSYHGGEIVSSKLWDHYEYGAQPICLGELAGKTAFRKL